MLMVALYTNDKYAEFRAYDMLSMAYYLRGDMERCKYFNKKVMRGNLEPEDSMVRKKYPVMKEEFK